MSLKNSEFQRAIPCCSLLINTTSTGAFPSSEVFDVLSSVLQSSDAERNDAIKIGNGIYAFTLKNKAGETESWHIDLKEKGVVSKGLPDKPTGMRIKKMNCIGCVLRLDYSLAEPFRRWLRKAYHRKSERSTFVYVGQTEAKGRCNVRLPPFTGSRWCTD